MIRFDGVGFGYRDGPMLLHGVDFAVEPGNVACLVGRNGAGKSTILRLASGLERCVEGRIRIGGQELASSDPTEIAASIGVVFQASDRHIVCASLLDEVALGSRLLGACAADANARARNALERVGLAGLASRHPFDLNAGERRLGGVAAAIAHIPRVLLVDEVQRGLDASHMRRLEAVIEAERRRGCAVLIACHDMDFVGRNAGFVLHVARGGVRKSTTRAFFACRPTMVAPPELHVLADGCGRAPKGSSRAFVDDVLDRLRNR